MRLYRIGSCKRCGKCCDPSTLAPRIAEYIARQVPFLVVGKPCPHLKRNEDGTTTCLIYEKRPKWCRDFPAEPADIAALPECGYRFIDERGRIVQ